MFSAPTKVNPVLDETGEYANINQDGPVWFLAGTFGENKIPQRSCKIPAGFHILFPVINYELNPLEDPKFAPGPELVKHVVEDINDIVVMDAIIDGNRLPVFRVQSDPELFPLRILDDNPVGCKGGFTIAAADGYWVFLKPLAKGDHKIYFHGACGGGIRNATADYSITIQ